MSEEETKRPVRPVTNEVVCEACGQEVNVLDALCSIEDQWWLECPCGALFPAPKRKHVPATGRFKALRYYEQEDTMKVRLAPRYWQKFSLVILKDSEIPDSMQRLLRSLERAGYEVAEVSFKVARKRRQ